MLIQVLGTSHYETDSSSEIDVLDRTFTVITDIAKKAVCLYVSEGAAVVKRQNMYDSPKSKAGLELEGPISSDSTAEFTSINAKESLYVSSDSVIVFVFPFHLN